MAVVVDTNVAVVAEGLSTIADATCVARCQDALLDIVRSGGLLLDDGNAIVAEYVGTLGHAGQPGVGRAFAKWVFNYQFDPVCCSRVRLTACSDDGWRSYEEFPDDDRLRAFDRDDQKFVSVAVASCQHPPILNAVDSDWTEHEVALADCGVLVRQLCTEQVDRRTFHRARRSGDARLAE